MQIEISKNEAWKILDAVQSYQKDYALTQTATKILSAVEKKMKEVTNSKWGDNP